MSQPPSTVRVKSGIPWWLLTIMVVFTGAVLVATIVSWVPSDPEKAFQDGLNAWEEASLEKLQAAQKLLAGNAEYAGKLQLLQGLELMAKSQPLKAVPVFEAASENAEVRIRALTYLGTSLARGDRRQQALQVLEGAIAEAPEDPLPRRALAGILYEMGAFERSLEQFETLIASGVKMPAHLHGLRSEMLMHLQRLPEAVKGFQAAADADAVSPGRTGYIENMAVCLLLQKDYEEVLKVIDGIPPTEKKEFIRGKALLGLGRLEEVRKIIEAATGPMANTDPRMTRKLEVKLAQAQEPEKAKPMLSKLRESVPMFSRDQEFYEALAAVAKMAGADEEAAIYLENQKELAALEDQYQQRLEAIVGNTDDAAGRLELGDLGANCGKYEDARFWFSAAGKVDPGVIAESEAKIQTLFYGRPEIVSAAEFRSPPVDPEAPQDGLPQEQPDAGAPPTNPPAAEN